MLKIRGLDYMWMMVMFDLPTETQDERHKASKFRNFLLDYGFTMAQYSVYFKFAGSREHCPKYVDTIRKNNPCTGNVSVMFFTDYQFGQTIKLYKYNRPMPIAEVPQQFMLF